MYLIIQAISSIFALENPPQADGLPIYYNLIISMDSRLRGNDVNETYIDVEI